MDQQFSLTSEPLVQRAQDQKAPLLSVCIITYNHEAFIEKAITSVLMQQVDVPWEIVIADDYSTDQTRQIIERYRAQHPHLIRTLLQPRNIGPIQNWTQLLASARGQFVAYLEGDDYWIHPRKLALQLAMLQSHADCCLCYTNGWKVYDDHTQPVLRLLPDGIPEKHDFSFVLRTGKLPPSGTILFRRSSLPPQWPHWFFSVFYGDLVLFTLLAETGKFCYLPDYTLAYRVHPNSWLHSQTNECAKCEHALQIIDRIDSYSNGKYRRWLNRHRADQLEFLAFEHLKAGQWSAFALRLWRSLRLHPLRNPPALLRGCRRLRSALTTLLTASNTVATP